MWVILFNAKSRELTEAENHDLVRSCAILDEGIPDRPIYSYAAREFCALLRSSCLPECANGADVESMLEKLGSLKVMLG